MTHEFKTPISTISLACEAMNDPVMAGERNDQTAPFVKMIDDENKRLGVLVEAILQSAVIDRGELKLKKEDFSLNEVVKTVAKSASFRIAGKDGDLRLNLPKEDIHVSGDRMHVTNMVTNLVDNAIKYSKDEIAIYIELQDQQDKIVLSISDKGIGIKKEYITKIFEKLYRIPMGNIHNVKGFGLGLSYVKAIIDLQGWNLQVKSQFGVGSEFKVIITKKP
jgi:two-component system, OmpR family, phosphate regulon sensor histidine kinase PhoR